LSDNNSSGQSIEGIHGRGEDEQELWKRSEREGDELRYFKGRGPLFLLRILPFHNMNVDLSMCRMQWENTESKRAQGQARRPRSVLASHTLLPLIFKIWKENFEKGKF
jgi:hypothetical protein